MSSNSNRVTETLDLPLEGTITEGDDYALGFTVEKDSGTAVDISNWTFYLTVKEHRDDDDADAIIGPKNITNHADPANGKTEVTISNSESLSLDGVYWYDVQVKKDTDNVQTFIKGPIRFGYGITDTTS